MKGRIIIPSLVFLLALAVPAGAQGKKKEKQVTVKGEVVDVSCYLIQGKAATGEKHKDCAEACAKAGGPLGILTSNGKLYVSVMPDSHNAGPNALLMDHIAKNVEVKGVVRTRGGVQGIMITSVNAAK